MFSLNFLRQKWQRLENVHGVHLHSARHFSENSLSWQMKVSMRIYVFILAGESTFLKKRCRLCNLAVHILLSWLYVLIKWKRTEPDGKSEDKNVKRKELSKLTSEQIPTGGSHDMEAVGKKMLNFDLKKYIQIKWQKGCVIFVQSNNKVWYWLGVTGSDEVEAIKKRINIHKKIFR